MSMRKRVPVWLLVAGGVTAAVFAFARKQNRGERVGGPISLPKTLWLNYTLISWFVLPGALLRRDDLSPGARAALQAHLMSFVARGSAEMWLLYRTHSWRVAYGVGHDALDLALITAALRGGRGKGGKADGIARRHLDAIRATLLFEMAFASLFHLAIGGRTKGEDGIYFASNEPRFRRINALTAAVDVAAYARMMLVMRDMVRLG